MKIRIVPLMLLFLPGFLFGQTREIDSLKKIFPSEKSDSGRVIVLNRLSRLYIFRNADTALQYGLQSLALANKINFARGKAISLNRIANVFSDRGNYPKALQLLLEALKIAESIKDEKTMEITLNNIGTDYSLLKNERLSVDYTHQALIIAQRLDDQRNSLIAQINLGNSYEKMDQLDSAMAYSTMAFETAIQLKDNYIAGVALLNIGNTYARKGDGEKAMRYYRMALPSALEEEDEEGLAEIYLGISKLFLKEGKQDSCAFYAKLALRHGKQSGSIAEELKVSEFLTSYYLTLQNIDSAFVYQTAAVKAKDSLFNQEKAREIQTLTLDETMRRQQIEEAKEEAHTEMKFNALIGGLVTLLLVALLLYRNNLQKQKANKTLQQQKLEIENQRDQTNKALKEVQQTQQQLIQSEKMASLGELTAGIAHEIQNPLNFVNNFSEVNKELIEEIKKLRSYAGSEREKGLELDELLNDISANEEKINYHGKRADAIVKGMLQHSQSSSGVKEPTNINALAEEYLRLSYHGLVAKDKTFAAKFETDFDKTIGNTNIIPQDIGRVLLNLYNNAFYAVNEKRKLMAGNSEAMVTVSTKKLGDKTVISVRDNGTGIPAQIADKVFQPFFTTKPTGQGTGLGLSLAYDIVKAQGGKLKMETKEGLGSEFTVEI